MEPTSVDQLRAALVDKLADTMDPDNAARMVLQFEAAVKAQSTDPQAIIAALRTRVGDGDPDFEMHALAILRGEKREGE